MPSVIESPSVTILVIGGAPAFLALRALSSRHLVDGEKLGDGCLPAEFLRPLPRRRAPMPLGPAEDGPHRGGEVPAAGRDPGGAEDLGQRAFRAGDHRSAAREGL
jgi:hypothetical protein